MKKLILTVAAVIVSVAAFAQGEVNFNNRSGSVDAKVTFSDTGLGVAAGFTAQLYGGPEGTALGALAALTPTTTFRTSSAAANGYINGTPVSVPGVAPGSKAALVMRVYPAGGAFTAKGDAGMGESNLIVVSLGGGTIVTPNMDGLQAFTVAAGGGPIIPEPSTIALAVLGAGALLLRRRK